MGGRKRRRKVAAIISAVAVIFLIAYVLLVNFLVSAALVPSFMEHLKAFETITEESYAAQVQTSDIERNRQEAFCETARWLETAARQKVSVRSEDGFTLIAETFSVEEGGENHNWVILLHGYTGWKEELYPFAYWYHEQGYHVLAPDLRCQGESEGDFIGMGWTDHYDGMLWVQYVLPQNVKAVISDCAYTDAYSMFCEKIGEWFGLPSFPFVNSACLALRLRGGYNLRDASALDAVRKSKTPTLFIHGEEDAMISVRMARELYEASAARKELLIVKDAGHAQSHEKDPDTYYGKVKAFLEETTQDMEN